MTAVKNKIPNEIKEFIEYNPNTGDIFWKKYKKHNALPGQKITYKDTHGYIQFSFNNITYFAHRVIWFLMTGNQPNQIDHINGVRDDNRWVNLRNTTETGNGRNKIKYKDHPGVFKLQTKNGQCYVARLRNKTHKFIKYEKNLQIAKLYSDIFYLMYELNL